MEVETRAPGRPRSEEAERAILDATMASLADAGFSGTTMAGIARDAGVSTATIYRRWSSLSEVVIAALTRQRAELVFPDTGSLADDLRLLTRQMVHQLTNTPEVAVLTALIDQARRDPDLAAAVAEAVIAPAREAVGAMFRRGIERGEVDPDVDIDLAIDVMTAPLYLRSLTTQRRLRPADADKLAALLLRAVQPT